MYKTRELDIGLNNKSDGNRDGVIYSQELNSLQCVSRECYEGNDGIYLISQELFLHM